MACVDDPWQVSWPKLPELRLPRCGVPSWVGAWWSKLPRLRRAAEVRVRELAEAPALRYQARSLAGEGAGSAPVPATGGVGALEITC